jgi:hypothetical protein
MNRRREDIVPRGAWKLAGIGIALLVGACGSASPAYTTPKQPPSAFPAQRMYDQIKLKGGGELEGTIVAENDAFYVVEKHGLVQMVDRDKISSVRWVKGSKPSGLSGWDQVVLRNGHVLTGKITERNDKFRWYLMRYALDENVIFRIYDSQVLRVFRDGKEVAGAGD